MKSIVLIGRIFFSLIFLNAIIGHFSQSTISYAEANGVPFASILVPLSGVLAFLGGLSILLGFKAKIGGWMIVAFLIPVTFMMHNFWAIEDPAAQQQQMTAFMKNISLLGGALLITYFGAGPLSIDASRSDEKFFTESKRHFAKSTARAEAMPSEKLETERKRKSKKEEMK